MEIIKNRPEIAGADHPEVIYRALMGSFALWGAEQPQKAREWTKIAQDAEGALQDGFGIIDPEMSPLNPNGNALLFMNPEDLSYTLTGYGVELLEKDAEANAAEVKRVEEIINKLDAPR